MRILSLVALLAIPTVGHCDVMLGPFSVLDPTEWPDTRIEITYDAQTLDLISGAVRWHFSSNQGTDGLDQDPQGWLDPATGDFDVTVDMINTDNGSPRTVRITPTTFYLDDSWSREFKFIDLGFYQTGDSNLDGRFDSSDLVAVMDAGLYERPYLHQDWLFRGADFETGDWNGDNEFNSGDLVMAFVAGGYEQPARAVPEPSALRLLTLAVCCATFAMRRSPSPLLRVRSRLKGLNVR